MKPRTFHITDFPNNVYVMVKDSFREQIFNKAIKKSGSREKLAEIVGVPKSTLEQWYLGERILRDKKTNTPMPIKFLKKILLYLKFNDLKKLERNILYIKGGGRKIIKNPKLPLKETPMLFSLIGNLLGDGYASSLKETPNYHNENKRLISEFKNKLKIFGDVPTTLNPAGNLIRFPKVIGDILKYLYQFECGSFSAFLPKILWKLPRQFIAATIGAIIDDDGTIADDKIEIYSASKKLLEDLLNLIHMKFPEIKTGKIIQKRKNYFFFQIYAGSFKHIKNFIPITHPDKKENLEFNIKRQKLRPKGVTFGKGVIKNKIIKLLSKKNLTTKEISRKLFIGRTTINEHLNHLKDEGKVTFIRVNKGGKNICRLWRLTDGT